MREEAMREAAKAAMWGFEPDADDKMLATAGADAERARVVAWFRKRAERTLIMQLSVELLAEADAIERGDHWPRKDSE